MNIAETAATAAKANAPNSRSKPAKPQRRMARPALNDAGTSIPSEATYPATQPAPATGNKTTAVVALLKREDGATLAELIAATGWLPHTTRATLTGLRKKGHVIERSKRGKETCYRIAKTG